VMQIGQAAGALAALSQIKGKPVRAVSVRDVQRVLLDAGCYIMPYLDLPKDHRHFKALQKIGATGILRGEGRNVGWANQTWFRADDPLLTEDIYVRGYYNRPLPLDKGPVRVGQLLEVLENMGASVPGDVKSWWEHLGLVNFRPDRTATRLEAAVVLDSLFDPFVMFPVDLNGNLR